MTRPSYPSDSADRLLVRFPAGMKERVSAFARANRRSMNSEVIVLLEAALAEESKPTTGGGFADTSPVVGPNETALQGGPITHG